MANYVQQMFEQVLENVSEVSFNPEWLNETWYWDGAVEGTAAPKLEVGQVIKTIDTNQRRAFFIGTSDGNIVIFERYKPTEGVPYGQVNYQVPSNKFLIYLFSSAGGINETKFAQFIDTFDPTNNIGSKMQQFALSGKA